MKLGADTKYVGIADNEKLFFENQFAVPGGFTCNSYVIIDEKCAVIDGVEEAKSLLSQKLTCLVSL